MPGVGMTLPDELAGGSHVPDRAGTAMVLLLAFITAVPASIAGIARTSWSLTAVAAFAVFQGAAALVVCGLWVAHRVDALFALGSAVPFLICPAVLLFAKLKVAS